MKQPPVVSLASCLALSVLALPAAAQPVGPDFRVNTSTTGYQTAPSVARTAGSDFVVAWSSATETGDTTGAVMAGAFTSVGAPLGAPFRVNSATADNQFYPRVASDGASRFVVVWISNGQDFGGGGVYAQRYAAAAGQPPVPVGGEFQVAESTSFDQNIPDVAMNASGEFVVTWSSFGQDAGGSGVYARRFSSGGAPLAGEFRVNDYTTGTQWHSRVTVATDGSFAFVWDGDGEGGAQDVHARFYASSGAPLAASFRVNTHTTGTQGAPVMKFDPYGGAVVVWTGDGAGGHSTDVYSQRFGLAGQPVGVETLVNTYTTGFVFGPSLSLDAAGRYVVVWNLLNPPGGNSNDVFARRFLPTGLPAGAEFMVNSYTTSYQNFPAASYASTGDFVVVWHGAGEGDNIGVFGRRAETGPHGDVNGLGGVDVADVFYLINMLFAAGPPPAGGADANGDGSVTVADVFYLINYLFAAGPPPV